MAKELYYDIRMPNTGHDFELLTQRVCEKMFDETFELYGRSGQQQSGVDLFNNDFSICIQCKNYQNSHSVNRILQEIKSDYTAAIKKHGTKMTKYVLATTVRRDTHIQDLVVELFHQHSVPIQVLFWEDFQGLLDKYPELLRKHNGYAEVEQKLYCLLESLYSVLCEFRSNVQQRDNIAINIALEKIKGCVQSIYEVMERYGNDSADIYEKCHGIVKQYNIFVNAYTAFVIELRNGHSLHSERLAEKTEEEFKKLLDLTLGHLQSKNAH